VNLNRLRMLSEIAGRGSFRAAALALDYSPSAISQQIALLEREAGVRLVQRGPRGAELTDAGRLLVRHADVALRELAKARRGLDVLSGNGTAGLRVAAFPTATATIVARAAQGFTVRVVDAEPPRARALLAAGDVDAAVLYEFESSGPGDLIGEDPMLLCLPADHPLAEHEEVDIADLAGELWVGGDGCPSVPALVELCRAAGFAPAFGPIQTHDYVAMQGLVAMHALVGLIPRLALVAPRPDVAIRRLRPEPPARMLRYAAGDHPLAERFGDELRAALGLERRSGGQAAPHVLPRQPALPLEPLGRHRQP
jgi:DNA-binding transcriptional LysR family regulator